MNSKYRYLIPNGITFLSLICGLVAIMLAASGELYIAGVLILTSYILDLFDGALARSLKADSEFGLQLDSLVDMVSLGTAPAVLAFVHLRDTALNMAWVWPFVILLALSGAFRLARFNLLPPKSSGSKDSAGLPISTGGAVMALAVLSDLTYEGQEIFPSWTFILLLLFMSVLMVSTLPFPSFMWIFSNKQRNVGLIAMLVISLIIVKNFLISWYFWTVVYLGVALIRAFYKRDNRDR